MKVSDLKKLKIIIKYSAILSLLIVSLVFVIISSSIYLKYAEKKRDLARQQIHEVVRNYESDVSEKLSIVASSELFLNYLRSGVISRQLMYHDFLSEVRLVNSSSIIGMQIYDYDEDLIYNGRKLEGQGIVFSYGKDSGVPLELKLCYSDEGLSELTLT